MGSRGKNIKFYCNRKGGCIYLEHCGHGAYFCSMADRCPYSVGRAAVTKQLVKDFEPPEVIRIEIDIA